MRQTRIRASTRNQRVALLLCSVYHALERAERDTQVAETEPDRELVKRAQRELPNRTRAYDQLVRQYSGPVFQRAYRILQSVPDAEEASQDVFLAVYRHLPRFRFERPFSHWVSTVTLNACRMILRRRASEKRRRDAVAQDPPPQEQSSDPTLRRVVLDLLDELDPSHRIPLVMRYLEGYTYSEIARELDISESAVKMRVSRSAKRLRGLYEEQESRAEPQTKAGGSDE